MKNESTAYVRDGGNGWFWATSPEVPGANGQGRTHAEAVDDLADAIELMLGHLRDKPKETGPDAAIVTVTIG